MYDATKETQELLSKARQAKQRDSIFEAEQLTLKALLIARQDELFDCMSKAATLLWQSRSARIKKAIANDSVTVVKAAIITEDMKLAPGAYIVQPPHVGADARRLRMAALGHEVPVLVVCREPITQARLAPVVAISPGITIRAKVDPPDNDPPELSWLLNAIDALGHASMATIDDEIATVRRIDGLIERLDALPESKLLHDELIKSCNEAHQEKNSATAPAPAKAKA